MPRRCTPGSSSTLLRLARQAALGTLEIHAAGAEDDFLRDCASRYDAALIDQSPGDLGDAHVERVQANAGGGTHGDPHRHRLPRAHARYLHAAAAALDAGQDAVLGPVEDGGYALIAPLTLRSAAFSMTLRGARRSVMEETRARLRQLQWRWSELETLWDVDRPVDYERLLVSGCSQEPGAALEQRR